MITKTQTILEFEHDWSLHDEYSCDVVDYETPIDEDIEDDYHKFSLSMTSEMYKELGKPKKITITLETGDTLNVCNCEYKNDPYKAPEQHATDCPIYFLAKTTHDSKIENIKEQNISFSIPGAWSE